LLVLNYSAGVLLRITPDFAVVPLAPPTISGVGAEDSVTLAWTPNPEGVAAVGYSIERVHDGAVVERLAVEGTSARWSWSEGDCLRVRGEARSGLFGPPSPALCFSR